MSSENPEQPATRRPLEPLVGHSSSLLSFVLLFFFVLRSGREEDQRCLDSFTKTPTPDPFAFAPVAFALLLGEFFCLLCFAFGFSIGLHSALAAQSCRR